jgi:hypothetical protein
MEWWWRWRWRSLSASPATASAPPTKSSFFKKSACFCCTRLPVPDAVSTISSRHCLLPTSLSAYRLHPCNRTSRGTCTSSCVALRETKIARVDSYWILPGSILAACSSTESGETDLGDLNGFGLTTGGAYDVCAPTDANQLPAVTHVHFLIILYQPPYQQQPWGRPKTLCKPPKDWRLFPRVGNCCQGRPTPPKDGVTRLKGGVTSPKESVTDS